MFPFVFNKRPLHQRSVNNLNFPGMNTPGAFSRVEDDVRMRTPMTGPEDSPGNVLAQGFGRIGHDWDRERFVDQEGDNLMIGNEATPRPRHLLPRLLPKSEQISWCTPTSRSSCSDSSRRIRQHWNASSRRFGKDCGLGAGFRLGARLPPAHQDDE